MKRQIFVSTLLVGLFLPLSVCPSEAQPYTRKKLEDLRPAQPMVNTQGLGKPGFYTDPRRLQIVNENPYVTDTRQPVVHRPNYDGMKVPGLPDVYEPAEGLMSNGLLGLGRANPMTPSAVGLPFDPYPTHMNALNMTRPRNNSLAPGITTGVSGRLSPIAPKTVANPISASANPLAALRQQQRQPGPQVWAYAPQAETFQLSRVAETSVHGRMTSFERKLVSGVR